MQRTTLVAGGALAFLLLTAAADGAKGGERHDQGQGSGRGHDSSNDRHGKARDKDKDHDQGPQLSRQQVRRLVERSLPGWDEEILEVADGKRWIEDVGFDRILGVLGEQPMPQDLPPGALQLRDDKRTVKLDPAKGKLRYVSRERAWSFERNFQKPAFDPQVSQARVLEAVRGLGMPMEEALQPQVETQMGAGALAGARRATDTFQMYRLVRLQRQIGGLPVFGSVLHAAISHEGQVQRLQVSWPSFALASSLRLRARSLVVDEAVQRILDQQPNPDTRLRASLVYAPLADEKGGLRYLPAVQLAVRSLPTPYVLLIPVAEAVEEEEEAPTPIP